MLRWWLLHSPLRSPARRAGLLRGVLLEPLLYARGAELVRARKSSDKLSVAQVVHADRARIIASRQIIHPGRVPTSHPLAGRVTRHRTRQLHIIAHAGGHTPNTTITTPTGPTTVHTVTPNNPCPAPCAITPGTSHHANTKCKYSVVNTVQIHT